MKRYSASAIVTMVLTILLAACGRAAPTGTAPTGVTASPTTGVQSVTATTASSGLHLSGTIRIASQSPLTGHQAASGGIGMKNSVELAIAQMTKPLTDMGLKVELVPFDDEADPAVGKANATRIVSDTTILCVVGHINSGVALEALPAYQQAQLAMVTPSNTSPHITDDFTNAFRVVGRDDVQGAVAEQYARETLGIQSVYIVHDKTDYGQGIAEIFRKNAQEHDIQVVGFEGLAELDSSNDLLNAILKANPDLIFFGGLDSQAGPFFKDARAKGIKAQFFGPDGMDSPNLLVSGGDAVKGMFYTTVTAPVSLFPNATGFASAYQAAYNEPAPPTAAQAYDASGICIKGIELATTKAGAIPTRAQVLAAISELGMYKGITGEITFNANGDMTKAPYFVLQVDGTDWNNNHSVATLDIEPPEPEK